MQLNHLSLTNFRLFSRLDMDVPASTVMLVGSNAQGKTSLLEAIYYLATFSSFHVPHDRQLINLVAAREPLAVGRLVGEYTRAARPHRLEVRLIQEPVGVNNGLRLRKEVLLDGVKRPLGESVGHFNAVIFLPQMSRIIEDGPEERRRYLNLTLGQVMPGYSTALGEYTQALTQRNALLKQLNERGGDQAQLGYWDEILSSRGAQIIAGRITALQELERLASRVHQRLTGGSEVLRIFYQPAYDPAAKPGAQYALKLDTPVDRTGIPVELIRAGFMKRLAAVRSDEITRGVTTTGPHRDEVRFLSNAIDLGDYGSRGQIRTAVLSLKLAEVDWIKERSGEWPVLLLDEILAELDTRRRLDLLNYLAGAEQALLTTTDLNLFNAEFVKSSQVWHVQAGEVIPPN